jgi:hypothetical protein
MERKMKVRNIEVGIRGPSSEVKDRVYGHLEQMEQHLRAVRRAEKRTDTKQKLLALENGLNTEKPEHSEVSASASGIIVGFCFCKGSTVRGDQIRLLDSDALTTTIIPYSLHSPHLHTYILVPQGHRGSLLFALVLQEKVLIWSNTARGLRYRIPTLPVGLVPTLLLLPPPNSMILCKTSKMDRKKDYG